MPESGAGQTASRWEPQPMEPATGRVSCSGNGIAGSALHRVDLHSSFPFRHTCVQLGAGLLPSLGKVPAFLKGLRVGPPTCLHCLATSPEPFQGCREELLHGADF